MYCARKRHFLPISANLAFPDVKQNLLNFAGSFSRKLQYFATKLGSFANYKMLAVAIEIVLTEKIKIQFK